MVENRWQVARLIPTSGINGADEQERRAASALLAVMGAVREFSVAMLKPLGAPTGRVEAFIEVPFLLPDGSSYRPDGVIRVTRAGKSWVCLVEFKTGSGMLKREQVEAYLEIAREEKFDAVLTISNELAIGPGVHPVVVDKRKLRQVAVHHRSWSEIVGEAIIQRIHRGVSDPDQAWLLGELIRYLEDPKSGAADFNDMGASWTIARDATVSGTLKAKDPDALAVAARFEQLMRFAALRLSRELGVTVGLLAGKGQPDASARVAELASELASNGVLAGTLRIPNTASDITVEANLRTGKITTSGRLAAPGEGRNQTRVAWLTRQLGEAHAETRIDAHASYRREPASALLGKLREDPMLVIDDKTRPIVSFAISQTSPSGNKRGVGSGCFIESVIAAVDAFYGDVVQQLRPWTAKAPKRTDEDEALRAVGVDTTPSDTPRPQLLLPAHCDSEERISVSGSAAA